MASPLMEEAIFCMNNRLGSSSTSTSTVFHCVSSCLPPSYCTKAYSVSRDVDLPLAHHALERASRPVLFLVDDAD